LEAAQDLEQQFLNFHFLSFQAEYSRLENKFNKLKRAYNQHQERIVELESVSYKENKSGNIAITAVETENLQLKKKLQVIEDRCNRRREGVS
jgi:hypothetical protein